MQRHQNLVVILLLICIHWGGLRTFAFSEDGIPKAENGRTKEPAVKPKVTTLELPYLSDYPGTDANVITDLKKHQAIMFTFRRGPDSKVSGEFLEHLENQQSLRTRSTRESVRRASSGTVSPVSRTSFLMRHRDDGKSFLVETEDDLKRKSREETNAMSIINSRKLSWICRDIGNGLINFRHEVAS